MRIDLDRRGETMDENKKAAEEVEGPNTPKGTCPRCHKPSEFDYWALHSGTRSVDIVIEFCRACKIQVERECGVGRCKNEPPCPDMTYDDLEKWKLGFEEMSVEAWPEGEWGPGIVYVFPQERRGR
jgi:hypothetical protein